MVKNSKLTSVYESGGTLVGEAILCGCEEVVFGPLGVDSVIVASREHSESRTAKYARELLQLKKSFDLALLHGVQTGDFSEAGRLKPQIEECRKMLRLSRYPSCAVWPYFD